MYPINRQKVAWCSRFKVICVSHTQRVLKLPKHWFFWTRKPGFLSMKWTALNCKRHQTSLTERWKARVCIDDAVCLVPRVRPRSLCAWQIPYERQSNVQNYNRGIFDLSLSFVHSVEFRFVANTCLDSSSIGWWLQTIQFKRDSLFLWKEWVEGLIRFSKGKRN